jgi:CheY-like chemotaxis protein
MRVLILDDNPSFARRVRDQLKPVGHEISACVDAQGARASAKANQPQLILADADLDRIEDSLRSMEQVLAEPAHLVLISEDRGPENEEIRRICERFGVAQVLMRPVPMLHLGEVVLQVLDSPPGLQPRPVEEVRDRPVAPWDSDPNWGMDRPEPQARTSRPVIDDPTLSPRPPAPRRSAPPPPSRREEPTHRAPSPSPPPPRPSPSPPRPRVQAPPPPPPRREEKIVNKANLRRLGNIWARRLSGHLKVENHPGSGLFADGAPVDIMSSIFARESIESRKRLDFAEGRGGSNINRHDWGQELLTRALTLATSDYLDRNGGRALQPCSWPEAIGDLELRDDLITLARSADGYLPLFDHITAVGVDGNLARDLSALVELGILRLSEPTRARVDKVALVRREDLLAEPEPELDATPRRRSGRLRMSEDHPKEEPTQELDAKQQLAALRKELANLSKADAWTILGIPSDSDVQAVKTASERLLQRYELISTNPAYGDDVHLLAREIAELVRYASKGAKPRESIPAGPDLSGLPPDQQLFERGRMAVEAENWELAQKCLRKAQRLKMDDPRIMAWRGWATWRLAAQRSGAESDKLRHEGKELMELADSWDASMDQAQFFLATAELESQQLERAEMRVQRLQRRGSKAPGLERLAARIEAARGSKKPG